MLRRRGLSEFSFTIHWPLQLQWTTFGLRLPAFSFTITCGNLTVGHFRLQLHVAILQWVYALNGGWQFSRLRMHVAAQFFPVEGPGSRGNLPESCSGRPTQRGH